MPTGWPRVGRVTSYVLSSVAYTIFVTSVMSPARFDTATLFSTRPLSSISPSGIGLADVSPVT